MLKKLKYWLKVKRLLLPVAIIAGASSAHALDLGGGLSVGATTDLSYTTGSELWELDVTPKVAMTAFGASLSAESDIDILSLNTNNELKDMFTGIDWKASYAWKGMTTYTEVSSDADFEFGNITMGVKYSF